MSNEDCKHEPLGGVPTVLVFGDSASLGSQVGIAVCELCGEVFSGLFRERLIPTPSEGRFEYEGPYEPKREGS